MATFDLLPAVDLRGGRVVRLRRGDFAQETAFSTDPTAVAIGFAEQGAGWLHVVDLDGARIGRPAHGEVIRRIVGAVGGRMRIEVAGGLRSADVVDAAFAAGAARVVIGTAALRDPGFAAELVGRYGDDRVVVALDVRDGHAVGEAWREGTDGEPVEDAIGRLLDAGVRWFEVTAIERDGMMDGPDLDGLRRLVAFEPARIIASGGIASIADLVAARSAGAVGAIVGRALYDGSLDLGIALEAVRGA